MTMKKIGIMGGTFDPIHNGHIRLGRQAYEEYDLDCIWYMPSRIPPHKKDHTITAAKDRLAMTAAAIAPYPYFKLSDFELRRTGGNTYTADTLRLLKEEYPDVEFFFIAGADAIASVSKWKDSDEMGKLARFVGVDRPGYELSEERRAAIKASAPGIDISFLTIEALAISSSELRNRLESGRSIRYLTPQVVVDHVMEHKLYTNEEVVHG